MFFQKIGALGGECVLLGAKGAVFLLQAVYRVEQNSDLFFQSVNLLANALGFWFVCHAVNIVCFLLPVN